MQRAQGDKSKNVMVSDVTVSLSNCKPCAPCI